LKNLLNSYEIKSKNRQRPGLCQLKIMNISKKTIFISLASAWIIFSLIYIPWDFWKHFKNEQLSQAYNLGRTDTINQAVKQAENDKCEPFSIYSNDKQVQVINTNCLKQAGNKPENK